MNDVSILLSGGHLAALSPVKNGLNNGILFLFGNLEYIEWHPIAGIKSRLLSMASSFHSYTA